MDPLQQAKDIADATLNELVAYIGGKGHWALRTRGPEGSPYWLEFGLDRPHTGEPAHDRLGRFGVEFDATHAYVAGQEPGDHSWDSERTFNGVSRVWLLTMFRGLYERAVEPGVAIPPAQWDAAFPVLV